MAADEMETDVLVLGAGSAGLYALPEIKKAGKRFLMANGSPRAGRRRGAPPPC